MTGTFTLESSAGELDGASVALAGASVGAGVPHWARHSDVGDDPRISVTGSQVDATRSSAVDAGFTAPRVSQTLSPTVFSSPAPTLALHTTLSPSHAHCASWKHLHEHWSIGADAQSVSDTFIVTTPVVFMQIGLHSNKVSSQPQKGAEASRLRSCSLRREVGVSMADRSADMSIVDFFSKP